MSRSQILMLLLLSVVFGLGAVYVAKRWMDTQAQPTVELEQVERHPVLIAANELEPGTVLEEKHFTTKQMEVDWIKEETLKSADQAIGKIVATTIYAGEMVNPNRLALPGEGATLAALIPENKRAVTIRVNDVIGVAGFLLPGNKVDVLNTISSRGNYANTRTILKNIKVLAVDQTAKTNDNKPVIVRAVTLEVTPKEAEKLLTENSKGDIQLALRNPHEVDQPVVAKRRAPAPSVTVIKGTQASKVRVSN
ncbi:Flp pilus assembly protein CpaB [Vibrio panuliri]|uniref:Flp pilus assembly protein CpaB n=1 Tax=Vibrio panuliri TaxID=1381081 RepID=A0A1Q9HCP3_9VIBR|nr:Flp pilus assembly protein CpaB [Vibrio panuliri]KAB1455226.1 Flp pilus assembly protein CpaB [Vibrio panuliri]OLQ87153.1 Flp pilus assembly protein CpaB [Vibrio panuliri]OLQ90927.1 Flp pilus assembly protein CpaB [Vibrio panuliri]